jgi:hypothetical protein
VPYLQGATMQIRNTSWKRIALIIGIAFVAIQLVLLCVYLIFADAIQRSIRETAIQYIRTQAQSAVSDSSTRLAVDVGNIDYTYLTGTLEIESIRVQYYDNANGRERSLRLALPSIEVTGLKFWDLLDGDGISIGTISVDKPRISLKGISGDTPDSATTSSADDADSTIVQLPRIPNIDSILHNVFVNAFPAFVQPLVIEQVEVRDLHVQSLDDNPTTLFGGNLSGASIRFGPVKVIPGERPVGRPFGDLAIDIDNWRRDYTSGKAVRTHGFHVRVNNNDSSLVVDSLLLRSPREYDYIVKGVRFSYRSMELGISWFSIAPSLNDNAFFARQKYRGDRFRISAGPVVLRDIDFDALARREAFHVTTVDVQSLDVNLVSNVALPKNPRAPRPKMLNEIATIHTCHRFRARTQSIDRLWRALAAVHKSGNAQVGQSVLARHELQEQDRELQRTTSHLCQGALYEACPTGNNIYYPADVCHLSVTRIWICWEVRCNVSEFIPANLRQHEDPLGSFERDNIQLRYHWTHV